MRSSMSPSYGRYSTTAWIDVEPFFVAVDVSWMRAVIGLVGTLI